MGGGLNNRDTLQHPAHTRSGAWRRCHKGTQIPSRSFALPIGTCRNDYYDQVQQIWRAAKGCGTMPDYHFERALFVVGAPNSGKSKQLRSIFRDARLGTNGIIPTARKLPDFCQLSNDRYLYLRLSSPHELGESLGQGGTGRRGVASFLKKTDDKLTDYASRLGRRWNFASAVQANAANNMPDIVDTCRAFAKYFNPERTRVVFLSPDRHGTFLQKKVNSDLAKRLRKIASVEVCWIDARDPTANGLLLADFFDFA